MRIVILSYTSGLYSRGVETAVEELVCRWRKKHTVKVVNYRGLRGVGLIKYLIKFRPDIIMPMNRGWQAVWVRLFCWWSGAKMVVSGQAGYKDRWSLLTRPDVFVAITKRSGVWSKKYGFGVRVEVILHGVNLTRFKPTGSRIRLNLAKPIILCVASGDKYKRVKETIQAVAQLDRGSLLLIGGSRELDQLGKKLLGGRFERKIAAYKDLPKIYRSVSVFTLVSEDSEAFGIVYLEALASGLPVVAPDDELRREILGKYGIYVQDITDKEEYSKKLQKACLKGKMCPDTWLDQFNWDKVADQYLQLFDKLLI